MEKIKNKKLYSCMASADGNFFGRMLSCAFFALALFLRSAYKITIIACELEKN